MLELNEQNFNQEIEKGSDILVMFYREKGCVYCDKAKPLFEKYAETADHACAMYKLGPTPDSVNQKYPIENFPTFYAFKDGQAVAKHEGAGDFSKMFEPGEPKKKHVKIEDAPLATLMGDEIMLMDQIGPMLAHLKAVREEIKRKRALFDGL